jgi:hypothetical protein
VVVLLTNKERNMTKIHTRGPWVAIYDSGTTDKMGQDHRPCTFGDRFLVAEGNRLGSRCIADCGYGRGDRPEEEGIANARLIAAAPELLDIAIMAKAYFEQGHGNGIADPIWHAAKAALAKVNGGAS